METCNTLGKLMMIQEYGELKLHLQESFLLVPAQFGVVVLAVLQGITQQWQHCLLWKACHKKEHVVILICKKALPICSSSSVQSYVYACGV
jgi:hypothetical protein